MFNGFSKETIDFMWNLRLNNEKPWFEAHKKEYTEYFLTPMKELKNQVYEAIDNKYKNHGFISKISRIYKDARRLRGGGPYRDNMWFSIEKPSEEWTATPVFWFEIAPENYSYGMGYYMAKPATMEKMRQSINKNPKQFEKLVDLLNSQKTFVLDGPEYSRKKEAPTEKTAQWYNKKSLSLYHSRPITNELFTPDLAQRLIEGFEFLMPFYDFFITLDA